MMERELLQLFDRQKFQQNARLATLIGDVESRYTTPLADDELAQISAAGARDIIRDEVMLIIPQDPPEGRQS